MEVPAKADLLVELAEGCVSIELGWQVIEDGGHEVPGFQVEKPYFLRKESHSVFLNNFDIRDSTLHYRIHKVYALPPGINHQATALCTNDILKSDTTPAY